MPMLPRRVVNGDLLAQSSSGYFGHVVPDGNGQSGVVVNYEITSGVSPSAER